MVISARLIPDHSGDMQGALRFDFVDSAFDYSDVRLRKTLLATLPTLAEEPRIGEMRASLKFPDDAV